MSHIRQQIRYVVCLASFLLALIATTGIAVAHPTRSRSHKRPHTHHRHPGDHHRRRPHRHHHGARHRLHRHRLHGHHRSGGHNRSRAHATWGGSDVPQIQVSGDELSWNAIPNAGGYVFVEKVPGQPDSYTHLSGTSMSPAPVPGKMVWFSVRPASSENAWATEVAISYPANGGGGQGAQAAESIGSLPFQVGLVAGSQIDTQLPFMTALGARTARLEFSIDTPVAQIVQACQEYARAGVRPLLLASFEGRLPSTAEAAALGTWASAVGPGGTAWNGGQAPNGDAVTDIEFGNETNFGYQFSDQSTAAFAFRAHTYALRARTAALAIRHANQNVGLLAIADTSEQGSTWISGMFNAVPDLGSLVAGWTVHPYGPNWAASVQATISMTHAAGAPANVPIWITEWGLSTDGGSCVNGGNYGFSACLTYGQAASTLQSTLSQMRARFGARIAAFYLFQASDQQPLGVTDDNQAYFGALQSNGAQKGNYTAAVEADLGS